MVVWPGCTPWPGPSSRTPILSRKKDDFAFRKPPPLSRSEVVAKVGEPDAWFPDLRVACYRVNEVTKRDMLVFVVIPIYVEKKPGYVDVAFIEFDENDHVRRSGMSTEWRGDKRFEEHDGGWPVLAKKWLGSQEPIQRKH